MELNRLFYGERIDKGLLAKFNLLTTLTPKWREDMRRKLEGSYDDSFMRLWNLASKRRYKISKAAPRLVSFNTPSGTSSQKFYKPANASFQGTF